MNTLDSLATTDLTEAFNSSWMFASDFDGTQFNTDEPAPGGVGVNEAYEIAIDKVLGGGVEAINAYRSQDGHVGRTASEIVSSLLIYCDGELLHKIHELKVQGASDADVLEFIEARPIPEITQGLVAMDEAVLRSVTDVFVAAKLDLLTSQIGQKLGDGVYWPRPTSGFLSFVGFLQRAKSDGGRIDTAVISAGHAPFIEKAYDIYEVPLPDIMITDEVVQALSRHISSNRRAKPAPLPMALAKRAWLQMYGQPATALRDPVAAAELNARIIYTGDSTAKDGGMAESSHVDFLHIDPENQTASWEEVARRIKLGPLAVRRATS